MLYSESSDTLHCLPIHSSSSLFAHSTTLIFTCLYLFTTSPLLTLVLSPFSLCSKISWSNLLNNLIPLLFITLTWQHFDPDCGGTVRAAAENGTFRKLVALKIHGYQPQLVLSAGPLYSSTILHSSQGSLLSKAFCTKPTGLLPSLPSSFLFNRI